MIQQDYILLILNCEKYKQKAENQKNTWLKTLPQNILYFHVLGNPNMSTDFLFDNSSNTLYVKTPDDYCSLPDKVISAYAAVHKTYKFKYILKTDDDQKLLNPNFFQMLTAELNQKMPNYGGFPVKIDRHVSTYYTVHSELPKNVVLEATTYCNGRFYFLHFKSVENLILKKDKIKNEYFEDYAIGYYLDEQIKQHSIFFNTSDFFSDQ